MANQAPGNVLVIAIAALGGVAFGAVLGATVANSANVKGAILYYFNAGMAAAVVGGLIGAMATGIATYIATSIVTRIPRIESLRYKISIYKKINEQLAEIIDYLKKDENPNPLDNININRILKIIENTIKSPSFVAANENIGPTAFHKCFSLDTNIDRFYLMYKSGKRHLYKIENPDSSARESIIRHMENIIEDNIIIVRSLESEY